MATMKLTTTNGELVDLMNGHFGVQDIQGKDFAFTVSKNISILQKALKEVEIKGTPSEEFMKFAQEIKRMQDLGDQEGMRKLEGENADLIAERKLQMEDVQNMLKLDAEEVELNVITKDSLPNNVSARQINNLEKIIV
jgi:hypothetical protein